MMQKEPARKNIIRGTSYYTGYVMEETGLESTRLTYITQSDPGGMFLTFLTYLSPFSKSIKKTAFCTATLFHYFADCKTVQG